MLGVHGVGGSNPPVPTNEAFSIVQRAASLDRGGRIDYNPDLTEKEPSMGNIKKQLSAQSLTAGPAAARDLVGYQDGSIVSREIIKQPTGTVTLFAFDADQGLSEHTAPFDALVQIIEGKALITIGGKGHDLGEGDLIIMPAGVPHAVRAVTRFKMMLVMVKK